MLLQASSTTSLKANLHSKPTEFSFISELQDDFLIFFLLDSREISRQLIHFGVLRTIRLAKELAKNIV